jgi:hypothetical protein
MPSTSSATTAALPGPCKQQRPTRRAGLPKGDCFVAVRSCVHSINRTHAARNSRSNATQAEAMGRVQTNASHGQHLCQDSYIYRWQHQASAPKYAKPEHEHITHNKPTCVPHSRCWW